LRPHCTVVCCAAVMVCARLSTTQSDTSTIFAATKVSICNKPGSQNRLQECSSCEAWYTCVKRGSANCRAHSPELPSVS
jgi:hypothetical protein